MKSTTEAFPYPVLTHLLGEGLDYPNDTYGCQLRVTLQGDVLQVEYAHQHEVAEINQLLADNKANYYLHFSCTETRLRKCIRTEQSGILELNVNEYYGKIEIVPMVIVRADNIASYTSTSVNPEYGDMTFELKRGDMLAIGQTHNHFVRYDDVALEYLMKIRVDEDADDMQYLCESDGNYLVIRVSGRHMKLLGAMMNENEIKPFLAMSYYKDALVFGLTHLIKNENQDADSHAWAQALQERLLSMGKSVPTENDFNEINELAQILLEQMGVGLLDSRRTKK